ncbi:glutamine amidotransferase subunit [Exophiala xenobiotica]|nr:glutamine amidotransferase subunit [Exophiala xenobiotica]KAK5215512.1 glutamine amidotransferase subunit [Exophiala xenobiotica]KAK5263297.1 glutamine amidotransferase subunit [Exophiala xenobiotica]KAK5284845.1 glutamine amidotransferase subunit [Exophiala xenobiotica]KAK5332579.1 glutamine amidotransferase subunit [Exophiala xenobiotica]
MIAGALKWAYFGCFLNVYDGNNIYDSEWAFALFFDTLEKDGVDPSSEPKEGFDTKVLRRAMKKTIAKINAFVTAVPAEHNLADELETRSLLNFAVTDGHSVIVTRYVSSKTDAAASLYYSSGTAWVEGKVKEQFKMERRDKASDVVLVASEPLTFERHNWLSVPTNTIVAICKQTVYVRPIKDESYDPDPSTERSTGFARSKGLVAKAPGGGALTPSTLAGTPLPRNEVETPGGSHIVKEDLERLRSNMEDLSLLSGPGSVPPHGHISTCQARGAVVNRSTPTASIPAG